MASFLDKDPVQLEVEHQQLGLLYSAIPSSLLASLFGCFVAMPIYQTQISSMRLYSWAALMLGVAVFRLAQFYSYRRTAPPPEQSDAWFVKFRIGALLQAFATTTLAPHRPIVVAFLLIIMAPIVVMVFFLQTAVTRYISLVLLRLRTEGITHPAAG